MQDITWDVGIFHLFYPRDYHTKERIIPELGVKYFEDFESSEDGDNYEPEDINENDCEEVQESQDVYLENVQDEFEHVRLT